MARETQQNKPSGAQESAPQKKRKGFLGFGKKRQKTETVVDKAAKVVTETEKKQTNTRKKNTGEQGARKRPTAQAEQKAPARTKKTAASAQGAPARAPRTPSKRTAGDKMMAEQPKKRTTTRKPATPTKPLGKLKVYLLGGLCEIGKNLTVFEYENDIVIIDCGLGFPDDDMLGIDLVIPDTAYLEQNADRIRGIYLTHGHEDHIGALPYVLRKLHVPVYGTRLTLGIIKNKLEEHDLGYNPKLICVKAGDTLRAGAFTMEFIHVNHSIADACAIAVHTPHGIILHTGDFKLDLTPIEGEIMDLARLGELGKEGVLMLMCESTNVERPGYTPSERIVGQSLDEIFTKNQDKRLVIATFSSNVHRVQQIINASVAHGRKVAITGRSMINIVGAAMELGYMTVPDGTIIDIKEVKRYPMEQVTVVTTGSQGEPMSALYRMAFAEHAPLELTAQDLVVLSSHAIPGNEKLVDRIINELHRRGVGVFRDDSVAVHVSGHACREELKLMHALIRPKYFMPIHGEYKHLVAHKALAEYMGMAPNNIFVSEIGRVLEIDEKGARWNGTVPSGIIMVDGYGVGDVGSIVLRDRKLLSEDGIIVVVATVDIEYQCVASGPDVVSRGFVYVREAEELMDELRRIAREALEFCLDHNQTEWNQMKTKVKDDIAKFIYSRTHRKPMILPIIMNIS